jgi:hypothetical protein
VDTTCRSGTRRLGPRAATWLTQRSRATRLTVLTYRNTVTGPNSPLDVGRDMLTRARPGTSIRLAIETQPLAECPSCTYFGARQAAVTVALRDIDRLASAYPAYAGVAVHNYQAWRALRS